MKTEISEQIVAEFKKFVQDQMKKIDQLNLENININPILAKTLGYQTPEEVVEFFVNQRFQRGVVTTFGQSVLEKKITKLFAESAGIEDVDLKFVRNSRIHYMQMKSGPEGFTGPALAKTIMTMERLKQKDPKIVTMIGFAYGKRNKLSKVWGPKLLQAEKEGRIDKVLVGREFWEFVLEDKNGYKIIIELAEKAGLRVSKNLESEVRTLENTRQDSYKRILKQFKEKYGEGLEAIEKMIEDNM